MSHVLATVVSVAGLCSAMRAKPVMAVMYLVVQEPLPKMQKRLQV